MISKYRMLESPCGVGGNRSQCSASLLPVHQACPASPCRTRRPHWCRGHKRATGPRCLNPAPAAPWVLRGLPGMWGRVWSGQTRPHSPYPSMSQRSIEMPQPAAHPGPVASLPPLSLRLQSLPRQALLAALCSQGPTSLAHARPSDYSQAPEQVLTIPTTWELGVPGSISPSQGPLEIRIQKYSCGQSPSGEGLGGFLEEGPLHWVGAGQERRERPSTW